MHVNREKQEVPLSPEIQGGKRRLPAPAARAALLLLGCPVQVFWDATNLHPGAARCTDMDWVIPWSGAFDRS